MTQEASRWFELFRVFGRAPSPDSYAAVFHPEGEVSDAGMPTPTPASQVRAAIARVLRLMPDLHIAMNRYRASGDAVFVDAANSGTINGTRVAWDSVYRVHLKDRLVHRGRRFYDQATLFRALRPDIRWLPELPRASGSFAGTHADRAGVTGPAAVCTQRGHLDAGPEARADAGRPLPSPGRRALRNDRLGG